MEEDNILKKVQQAEYEALKEIVNICDKNKLKYFLRGGSALGAIKYKGFVPWDDDIDIVLPRDDYEKLIEIMPVEFANKYLFVSYHKVKNAHCYFSRVILKDDIRIKNNFPKNNERGTLLIDVLPLDGVPTNRFFRKFLILKIMFLRMLASLWTIDVKDTVRLHEGKKEKILFLLYKLKIHYLYKQDTIYKIMDKTYKKNNYNKCKMAGVLSGSKMKYEMCDKEWWGDGRKVVFEDIFVNVPSESDLYLKKLFGNDYLTYNPPIEERTKSHLKGSL